MGDNVWNFRAGPHVSGGQLVGYGLTRHHGGQGVCQWWADLAQADFLLLTDASHAGQSDFEALVLVQGHPWRAPYLACSGPERAAIVECMAAY